MLYPLLPEYLLGLGFVSWTPFSGPGATLALEEPGLVHTSDTFRLLLFIVVVLHPSSLPDIQAQN